MNNWGFNNNNWNQAATWNNNLGTASYPMMNNSFNQMPQPSINSLPRYNIIEVNGEAGVDMFQMGPNSSVLLADQTGPIIWKVQTDGAGAKTKQPFQVVPIQKNQPVDINNIEARLSKLEELYNNEQSTTGKSRKRKQQRTDTAEDAAD